MSESEDLKKTYRSLASEWYSARDKPELANRLFRKHHALYKTMRETSEGRSAILALLNDPEPAVRLLAGTHSLGINPELATRTLEEIQAGGGVLAMDAEYALIGFRDGTLNLDW